MKNRLIFKKWDHLECYQMADIQFKCTSLANFQWNHQIKRKQDDWERFDINTGTQSSTANAWAASTWRLVAEADLPGPPILLIVVWKEVKGTTVQCNGDLLTCDYLRDLPLCHRNLPRSFTLGSILPRIKSKTCAATLGRFCGQSENISKGPGVSAKDPGHCLLE